jgi:Flp pilus assembly protein protease CpaA
MVEASFIFLLGLAVAGTAIGTYSDIKTRLVPDYINYFMIFAGFGSHAIISVLQNNAWPLLFSLAGAGALFGIGYLLYKVGAWGGGDTKLLTAYGAIFAPFPAVAIWPYILSLWINILIFGALFGIIGMFLLLYKHRDKSVPALKQYVTKHKYVAYSLAGIAIPSAVLSAYDSVFLISFFVIFLAVLVLIFSVVEKTCLVKKIRPAQLVEGDWITSSVKTKDFVYEPKKSGAEKNDIENLIKLEKEGKLDSIEVKDGLPYLPAFLAAVIATAAYGDIFYNTITKFMGV